MLGWVSRNLEHGFNFLCDGTIQPVLRDRRHDFVAVWAPCVGRRSHDSAHHGCKQAWCGHGETGVTKKCGKGVDSKNTPRCGLCGKYGVMWGVCWASQHADDEGSG